MNTTTTIKPFELSSGKPIIIGIIGTEGAGKDTLADHLVAQYGFIKYNMAQPIKEIARIMFGWSDELLNGRSKDLIDPVTGIKPREFYKWFGTDIAQHDMHTKFPGLTVPPREIWVHSMKAFVAAQQTSILPKTRRISISPNPPSTHYRSHSILSPAHHMCDRANLVESQRLDTVLERQRLRYPTLCAIRNNPTRIIIPDIRFIHEARAIRELGGILIHLTTTNSTHPGLAVQQDQQPALYDIPTLTEPTADWLHCTFNNPRVSISDFHSKINTWLTLLFNVADRLNQCQIKDMSEIEFEDDSVTVADKKWADENHEYSSNLSIYI